MRTKALLITEDEKKLLRAYKEYYKKNNYAPAIRDMMEAVGCNSTSTIRYRLIRLVDKGYLSRVANISRAIILTEKGTLFEQEAG